MTLAKKIAWISAIVIFTATISVMITLKMRPKPTLAGRNPVVTKWNNASLLISPFTKVRFEGENALVTYAGSEYQLAAINEVSAAEIMEYARNKYKDQWQKRFAEDLLTVLNNMGHPIMSEHSISLTLVDPQTGQSKDIDNAEMTAANRSAIHRALPSDADETKTKL
jgi:hypothetical protein